MECIEQLIQSIKRGDSSGLSEVHQRFRPLIISWLKQTKELYQQNREDYESMAKIILLECIKKYDTQKGVPFESFYKITLYHWYANHKRKKTFETVKLTEDIATYEDIHIIQQIEYEEKKQCIQNGIAILTEQERFIILRVLENFTPEQIAQEMNLSKKTILNKKYQAIAKLKSYTQEHYNNSDKIKQD